MKPAIRVEHLSKRYRLGAGRADRNLTEAVRAGLGRAWRGLARRPAPADAGDFWALADVSFDVRPGEVVGVIGRNGAGKSTLLKVLSRIVEPTGGRAEVRGRIGSLLEVGTGFHPELSGRENVYLNGSVLGMTRREIARKFDEIVAFSGVERFLDTPVKRYSSGMYVRLAFAVAAHLEPEILVVDEVLAVGDQQFQEKCLGAMADVGRSGRTILFVSHNLTAVQKLCRRVVVLQGGRVEYDGDTAGGLLRYLRQTSDLAREWVADRPPGGKPAALRRVAVVHPDGVPTARLPADRGFAVEVEYEVFQPLTAQVAFRVNTHDGVTVFTTGDGDAGLVFAQARGVGRYVGRVAVPGHLLAPGRYHLLVAINQGGAGSVDVADPVLSFEVEPTGSLTTLEGRLGYVAPQLAWTTAALL